MCDLRAQEQCVSVRFERVRVAETERGHEADRRISRNIRRDRGTRSQLARVREVGVVQLRRGNRGEEICAYDVDLRWTLDTVRGVSVSGNIKSLVSVFRIVEVVRDVE